MSSSLCNFLSLNEDNQARQVFDVRSIGFWCFETEEGRRFEYSGDLDEFDDRFEAARGLGFTANIFGFVIWLVYHAAACFAYPPPVFWVTAFFCFLTCMFEGTTYVCPFFLVSLSSSLPNTTVCLSALQILSALLTLVDRVQILVETIKVLL